MPGTLLIADSASNGRILLKSAVAPLGYDVLTAERVHRLFNLAHKRRPVLIVLSDTFDDYRAADVCGQLRADAVLKNVPVIILSSTAAEADRLNLLQAGADEVFCAPVPPAVFQARIRSLIRTRTGVEALSLRDGTDRALGFADAQADFGPVVAPSVVALVCPTEVACAGWDDALKPHMNDAHVAIRRSDGPMAQIVASPVPDVFVIAFQAGNPAPGLRLVSGLRANPATRHCEVLAVFDPGAPEDLAADALDLGASDVMMRGFEPRELALRLRSQIRRKQTQDRLRASVEDGLRASIQDPLTGLYNRRYAMPYLARVIAQQAQTGRSFAVMLADVDHFKSVNDRFGHAVGDQVLRAVAARLKDDFRAEDLVARMGGEEFLIVLPDSSREVAEIAAERLRSGIDKAPVVVPGLADPVAVSVSVGVAVSRAVPGFANAEDRALSLLRIADAALYEAKGAGRNTVTLVDAA